MSVTIHSYRFAFGLAEGDTALTELEKRLATKPKIVVPAVTLDGIEDPLKPGGTADHAGMFVDIMSIALLRQVMHYRTKHPGRLPKPC